MKDELKSLRFNMVIAPSQLARIDAWRKAQPDLPSRSEAMRSLVNSGLDASFSAEMEAALAAAQVKAKKSRAWIIEKALSDWLEARTLLPKGDDDQPTS